MVGGAMLGTDHRLNLGGIDFPLKGPQVTVSKDPTPLPPLCPAICFLSCF